VRRLKAHGGGIAVSLPRLWISKRLGRIAALAAGAGFVSSDSSAAGELLEVVIVAQGSILQGWQAIMDIGGIIGQGEAPALLLGLSVLVAAPVLVVAGLILRKSGLVAEVGRTMRYRGGARGPAENPPLQTQKLPVLGDASLTIQPGDGSKKSQHKFNGALMVRIGREDDNDVRLTDATVHRYHAVISRSAEAGFVISDLSSDDGNGITVNGKRVKRQRLEHGDKITLGTAKLTFKLK